MTDARYPIIRRTALVATEEAVRSWLTRGVAEYEFIISFSAGGYTVRELNAYLELWEAAYGRVFPDGYRSYAAQPREHIRIDQIRLGSTELVVALANLGDVELWQLIISYVVIRSLPSIIKGEAAKNWAEAAVRSADAVEKWSGIANRAVRRRQSRAPRFTRAQRAELRRIITADPLFRDLPARFVREIINAVEAILAAESERLPSAMRFAEEHVRAVAIREKRRLDER